MKRYWRPFFFYVSVVYQQVVPAKNNPVLTLPNDGHDSAIDLDNHRRLTFPLHISPPKSTKISEVGVLRRAEFYLGCATSTAE
jgi:hypothetical protein